MWLFLFLFFLLGFVLFFFLFIIQFLFFFYFIQFLFFFLSIFCPLLVRFLILFFPFSFLFRSPVAGFLLVSALRRSVHLTRVAGPAGLRGCLIVCRHRAIKVLTRQLFFLFASVVLFMAPHTLLRRRVTAGRVSRPLLVRVFASNKCPTTARECLEEIKETGSPDRHICLMTGWVISVYLGRTPRNHLSTPSSQTLVTATHTQPSHLHPPRRPGLAPHHLHFTLDYLVKTRNFRHKKDLSNTFKGLRQGDTPGA